MKTVEFRYSFDPFLYRTNSKEAAGVYVLASETNEVLDASLKYQVSLSKTVNDLSERIKVLEENLRILLSAKITSQDGAISLATNEERYQKARAALEVK